MSLLTSSEQSFSLQIMFLLYFIDNTEAKQNISRTLGIDNFLQNVAEDVNKTKDS